MYTTNLSASENTPAANLADDTAILTAGEESAIASVKRQGNISGINEWAKKSSIEVN